MLKKELAEELALALRKCTDYEDTFRNLQREISDMRSTIKDYHKLQDHRDAALEAINAIQEVNCRESLVYQEHSHYFHQLSEKGEEIPDRPEDKLFDALNHIEGILRRSVKEQLLAADLCYNRR